MAAEGLPGLVVALVANFCWVQLDQQGPGGVERLLCTRRTRLAKGGQTVWVGDRVRVEGIDWVQARAAVSAVDPRRSLLQRPAVANVNRVVVVVAMAEPALDPFQLCRFLITAEASGQEVLLVLSKADLVPPQELAGWLARISSWGYGVQAISTHSGAGLPELRALLAKPGISVLSGPSGVGKSSLLNCLKPDLELRVGAVSGRLQRGRHTTRHVELFALAPGALVADTPGFNRPEWPSDPSALAALFPELRQGLALGECRFSNCLHQGDPGCAIGTDWDRYGLYGQCLAEVIAVSERLAVATVRPQPGLRQRGGRLELRLDPSLRQASRRRQRQGEPEAD
ncbi:ribosome small subunit-dependent GTPase A [Cyanobium sp. HWJ4-Hawea]|uniref:ribosome small subunit-dependent GTPase A n=1 Tax=Cyanobium sp. HWJ4-Hawea TaxID=2823713 RepID=UPI0020CE6C73|nr:ribosome small subunit-dependent GTPase A [Cyanobium sp. HWJ4-Hawea]MCP9808099.1 ribosome small subunit-dependent GTPase A [Cyanobium sp. HWJ4-Hawea]